MRLSRWMLLIGILVGVGCLQVAQHNALFLRSYAVGERIRRVQAQENETSWLQAQVIGLSSPTHLAKVGADRQLKLVAWLRFPVGPSLVGVVSTETSPASDRVRAAITSGGTGMPRLRGAAAINPSTRTSAPPSEGPARPSGDDQIQLTMNGDTSD